MAEIHVERVRRMHPIALLGLALALVALLMLLATGPGSRFGWWHFPTSFSLMRYAAYMGLAAALVSLAGLLLSRGRWRVVAVAGLALGVLTWFLPWSWRRDARQYPGIHDITTDTQNPPAFVAVVPLRQDAPNPVEYPGDSVAQVQREAYPDIQPLMMAMPVDSAFSLAVRVVHAMGWELVDQDRGQGRIEATATTPWMGFKDDVVIRVSSASGIARVDVRSKSRVGRGDAGANANRIRQYLQRLRALDPRPIQTEPSA
ncbi:MAG TPA: DUF1499 domain-containing protein [Longimicrobium sp.]|nr:DUF1499 domain-containing protein [Longimicrobium sp.]